MDAAEKIGSEFERIRMKIIENPDEDELEAAIADSEDGYDIVHYVGFGRLEGDEDHVALGSDGGVDYFRAETLCEVLRAKLPRVVVLQLCETEQKIVPADLSVFAPHLLEEGVEVVVAFQYPVGAELNERFIRVFYETLAMGASVEIAVQTARRKMFNKDNASHAFLSPAIFVSRLGGTTLTVEATQQSWSRTTPVISYV
jgi:CHAT domain-containing protein